MENNHTSATCAQPGENQQRAARTQTNTMGGSMHGMHKNVLPSAVDRQGAPTCPPPHPSTIHSPSCSRWAPIDRDSQQPSTVEVLDLGPHDRTYQRANNSPPPPQPGTMMMHNTMAFINAYTQAPPPTQSSPAPPNQR